ncbi:hypothetical protein C5L39_02715 [Corynebacterium alimapuense]|uniref:DUF4190 domain-containing protein n=2 Tax=Corynebacterium alimapuense TaxID=1576874 RepID=A0A3M8K7T6_9CORY|nr:hypothetical protein C5L39_02715 [Corynebacterium alimapuense]
MPAITGAIETQSNRVAAWALGLAIAGLILFFTLFGAVFAIPVAMVSLILSVIAIGKARKLTGADTRFKMSVTALVISAATLVLSIILWATIFMFVSNSDVIDCFEVTDAAERDSCLQDSVSGWLN